MSRQRAEQLRRQLSTWPRNVAFTFLKSDTGYASDTTTDIVAKSVAVEAAAPRPRRHVPPPTTRTKPVQRLVFIKLRVAPTNITTYLYRILFKYIAITWHKSRRLEIPRELEELKNKFAIYSKGRQKRQVPCLLRPRLAFPRAAYRFIFIRCMFLRLACSGTCLESAGLHSTVSLYPYYTFSFYINAFK